MIDMERRRYRRHYSDRAVYFGAFFLLGGVTFGLSFFFPPLLYWIVPVQWVGLVVFTLSGLGEKVSSKVQKLWVLKPYNPRQPPRKAKL